MKKIFLFPLFIAVICLTACGIRQEGWNVEEYEQLDDIVKIEKLEMDGDSDEVSTYVVRYKSDECEVMSYLSIPNELLANREAHPCIIFNRGGNRDFGANDPRKISKMSDVFNRIIFASQYRGVGSGTGREEFGGDDLHDVIKLIDICEQLPFVDMDRLYMMGLSRGGMMTYMAAREDPRIKKAVVVSGLADTFMSWEERLDARDVLIELIGKTPEEAPEEYEKRSATYWADEIKCPIMIIHSKLDKRASYAQAEKMVQRLEEAGKEYEFISYEDDVHGFHTEDVQIILDWFQ